jgi:hypothetical protein
VKYGLGGSARLSEAVRAGVSSIVLDVILAGSTFAFERDIEDNRVKVSQGGDHIATLHATSSNAKGTVLASHFLLQTLGLPVMRVRRTRAATSSAKETISFWDIYRYAYVSQNEMGESIAGHAESNLDRKRRRAFELMFGLLGARLAELETSESETAAKLMVEIKRLADITSFLEDAGVPSRAQALSIIGELELKRSQASAQLDQLRSSGRSASADLIPDRNVIGNLYARRARLEQSASQIRSEIDVRDRLVAQLTLDVEGLERSSVTSEVLSSIGFRQCPRCLQAVQAARADHSHCYLCMQEMPPAITEVSASQEAERVSAVLQEVRELQLDDEQAIKLVEAQLNAAGADLNGAEERLRARTDAYVAPLFEEISTLSAEVAKAGADEQRLQLAMAQWDERARIQKETQALEADLARIEHGLVDERARLEGHRGYVQELSETFDEIVRELELAWYSPASVDLHTYLPAVGQADYESLSGGQRTVVSVAYHLALLTVGLVHSSELSIPSLLILDTPSKYLGNKDAAQVARDYRRIAAIVDSYKYPIQIIVADNDSPPQGVRPAGTIELSYEQPLVPGYLHPGGDVVKSIHDEYDEE